MGMKSTPAMPPPVDTSITDRTAEKEAKLAKEKQKMLDGKKKGMAGTVLTSGMGVDEDANTGNTLLGSNKGTIT